MAEFSDLFLSPWLLWLRGFRLSWRRVWRRAKHTNQWHFESICRFLFFGGENIVLPFSAADAECRAAVVDEDEEDDEREDEEADDHGPEDGRSLLAAPQKLHIPEKKRDEN